MATVKGLARLCARHAAQCVGVEPASDAILDHGDIFRTQPSDAPVAACSLGPEGLAPDLLPRILGAEQHTITRIGGALLEVSMG